MSASYGQGGTFLLAVPDYVDWVAACNAFLDLMIDGLAGEYELVAADRDNQYRVAERPAEQATAVAR
ncbi:MAG: hypothetical protein E5Y31_29180 [Mesorhizobium sp.]|nr:MAG: hypothetical protein E5Y31_29180 [Mesorhizobium sp.]